MTQDAPGEGASS